MFQELVKKNRSYRRFDQEKKITKKELMELIDIARLTPCGGNKQLLRFLLSDSESMNDTICENVGWAAYLKEWQGPQKGERPSAYVVMLAPKGVNTAVDEGIIGQTILLAATERNIGGCFLANVNRPVLEKELSIPAEYEIKLILALGYPKENVVIDTISKEDSIQYYRDSNQVHHVPKIKLEDLIVSFP